MGRLTLALVLALLATASQAHGVVLSKFDREEIALRALRYDYNRGDAKKRAELAPLIRERAAKVRRMPPDLKAFVAAVK